MRGLVEHGRADRVSKRAMVKCQFVDQSGAVEGEEG